MIQFTSMPGEDWSKPRGICPAWLPESWVVTVRTGLASRPPAIAAASAAPEESAGGVLATVSTATAPATRSATNRSTAERTASSTEIAPVEPRIRTTVTVAPFPPSAAALKPAGMTEGGRHLLVVHLFLDRGRLHDLDVDHRRLLQEGHQLLRHRSAVAIRHRQGDAFRCRSRGRRRAGRRTR